METLESPMEAKVREKLAQHGIKDVLLIVTLALWIDTEIMAARLAGLQEGMMPSRVKKS
ncbi:MAG: hypothetical protein Q7R64_01310 [bacterium]|nr:hypothetical protein [bacterium]